MRQPTSYTGQVGAYQDVRISYFYLDLLKWRFLYILLQLKNYTYNQYRPLSSVICTRKKIYIYIIYIYVYYILLAVHPNIMIVFLFINLMHKFFILIHLLHSPTCFEHYCAHLQEDKLYEHSVWYRHSPWVTVQYTDYEWTQQKSKKKKKLKSRRLDPVSPTPYGQ